MAGKSEDGFLEIQGIRIFYQDIQGREGAGKADHHAWRARHVP
jgi:hypothetical protein